MRRRLPGGAQSRARREGLGAGADVSSFFSSSFFISRRRRRGRKKGIFPSLSHALSEMKIPQKKTKTTGQARHPPPQERRGQAEAGRVGPPRERRGAPRPPKVAAQAPAGAPCQRPRFLLNFSASFGRPARRLARLTVRAPRLHLLGPPRRQRRRLRPPAPPPPRLLPGVAARRRARRFAFAGRLEVQRGLRGGARCALLQVREVLERGEAPCCRQGRFGGGRRRGGGGLVRNRRLGWPVGLTGAGGVAVAGVCGWWAEASCGESRPDVFGVACFSPGCSRLSRPSTQGNAHTQLNRRVGGGSGGLLALAPPPQPCPQTLALSPSPSTNSPAPSCSPHTSQNIPMTRLTPRRGARAPPRPPGRGTREHRPGARCTNAGPGE